MKYLIYTLSIGSLVGTNYGIITGVTWADITCFVLFVISFFKYVSNRWKIDRFCKLSALYIPFMLGVAVINGTLMNTIFINYFRNYIWGIVVYFALSNSVKSIQDIKKVILMGSAFLFIFILNYRAMMQDTYFENLSSLDFGYGRNNVAFTALLFAIIFEFMYYAKLVKSYILVGIVIMASIIVFCTSRYAMMMFVITFLIFRFLSHKIITISEVITIVSLCIFGPIIYEFVISFADSSFYAYSQNYLNEKINGSGDDFWNSRILSINVKPIKRILEYEGTLFLFFGKPLAIQHSFFSHTLITTGIAGCLCYLITNIKLLLWSFQFKGVYLFLFIVIFVMFTNDFITNARFIIGVNSIFYGVICAIIYRYIVINENTHIS